MQGDLDQFTELKQEIAGLRNDIQWLREAINQLAIPQPAPTFPTPYPYPYPYNPYPCAPMPVWYGNTSVPDTGGNQNG